MMNNSSPPVSGALVVTPSTPINLHKPSQISQRPSHSYVGEVGLWTGIWAISASSLTTPYSPRFTWLVAGVSPLLTWLLLRKISGVPPLEVRSFVVNVCILADRQYLRVLVTRST